MGHFVLRQRGSDARLERLAIPLQSGSQKRVSNIARSELSDILHYDGLLRTLGAHLHFVLENIQSREEADPDAGKIFAVSTSFLNVTRTL